jgi:glycosyltransferase involved in cell wall biosynthesis
MSDAPGGRTPAVSVVVVVYNMARAAPRTLHSLSAGYQRHMAADDYEVIVVDNGSTPPLDPEVFAGLAGRFRLIRLDPPPPSLARAINLGLAEARGEVVGVMVDGARIVTPGLLHFACIGASLYPRSIVASLGWLLGFDLQRWAMRAGYDTAREDALLASIDWPQDGYRLFEISALDGSSTDGWFRPIAESNALFLRREIWDELGGVDERFDAAGGGFLNLDTLNRAIELPGSELVILLGEGTFHQLHGGIATNAKFDEFAASMKKWREQYESIRGRKWSARNVQNRTYLGTLPRPALVHFVRAAVEPLRRGDAAPLGASFDRGLWSIAPATRPQDPAVAALMDLAEAEFRARRFEAAASVARLARARAPDEPAPLRLLAHAGGWLHGGSPANKDRRAGFHLARAKAYQLVGEAETAASEYRLALDLDPGMGEAHLGLASLRIPGPGYLHWLQRLHAALVPDIYLEIGVHRGASLACARPPTRAIGVDPELAINAPLKTETQIFCETSDTFFARQRLAPLLNGRALDLVFLDGLHQFQQSLRDFSNVEAFCDSKSVVLIHDTIPFDERTQRPERELRFHTGDVWKTVLCLKHFRPQLDVFTIRTPPSGLTVVTGLDPLSRTLRDRYDEAIDRFARLPFGDIENDLAGALNSVANDWNAVRTRLAARGILPPARSSSETAN